MRHVDDRQRGKQQEQERRWLGPDKSLPGMKSTVTASVLILLVLGNPVAGLS